MKRAWNSFLKGSLWLASIGLMLTSSGLDGAYLMKLMPQGWAFLGLILNLVLDVSSEIIMYWFGRLRQDAKKVKRVMSWWLLLPQAMLVGYAWLLTWRQILPTMRILEPTDYRWLAPLLAGIVPTAIVAIGFALSLLAGKIETDKPTSKNDKVGTLVPTVAPQERKQTIELSPAARQERALTLWTADSSITQAQMAERLGVSRQTVGKDYKALADSGKVRRNGRGVEVN